MINVLVVDDEEPAVAELAYLLGQDARVGRIATATSAMDALTELARSSFDAVFLDIHMPGMSGLEVARSFGNLNEKPALVFVTADEDFALQAFELAAVDYLLKPVRPGRLARSVERIAETASASTDDDLELIPVELGGITRMVRREEVLYVQAQGDYARLHTAESSYLVRIALAELEQSWAEAGFLRIHRSYLVAVRHVHALRLGASAPGVHVGQAELPISRRLLPAVRSALGSWSGRNKVDS